MLARRQVKNIPATDYGVTVTANKNPLFHPRGSATNGTTITISKEDGYNPSCFWMAR